MALLRLSIAALLASAPGAAGAQSLRDDLRDVARAGAIGSALHTFSVFGGVPGISAATYDSDGVHLDSTKVPIAYTFGAFDSGWLAGVAPYGELTLSYLHARENGTVAEPGLGSADARLTSDAFTGLAGAGLDIPVLAALGGRTVLRPILLAGYARIDSNTRFSGTNAAAFSALTQGLLTNASLDSLLLGGALALVHDRTLGGDVDLRLGLRFNQLADIGLQASDPALNTTNGFSVATAAAELKGPTGIEIAGLPLRWIGFASGTWMFGQGSDALGFSSFAELGAGLELGTAGWLPLAQAVSLRGSALLGDNVSGWSVGLAVSF